MNDQFWNKHERMILELSVVPGRLSAQRRRRTPEALLTFGGGIWDGVFAGGRAACSGRARAGIGRRASQADSSGLRENELGSHLISAGEPDRWCICVIWNREVGTIRRDYSDATRGETERKCDLNKYSHQANSHAILIFDVPTLIPPNMPPPTTKPLVICPTT